MYSKSGHVRFSIFLNFRMKSVASAAVELWKMSQNEPRQQIEKKSPISSLVDTLAVSIGATIANAKNKQ